MDAVKAFNGELQSLYETKPPISKAKMTLITRSAMKAIKFYKHVVQSVEKFIQKCKPEYKVPGLYVIDSIVRQSRHQYTPEKDVFAPRFSRNIKTTFLHLFNCSQEDKSKIIRVLNLWQKNNVFTADVIQPLLDLAASAASKDTLSTNGVQVKTPPSGAQPRTPNSKSSPTKDPAWLTAGRNQPTENNNTENKSTPIATPKVKMDKKLFDYDYGEDDDEDRVASASPIRAQAQSTPAQQTPLPNLESLSSILSNPEVLRQLHTLQQQMAARQQQQEIEEKMRRLQEMKHQEEEFDRHLAQTVPKLPFAAECEFQPNLSVGGVNNNKSGLPSGVAPPSGIVPLPNSVIPPPSGVIPPSSGLTLPSGVAPPSSIPSGVPPVVPPSGVPLPASSAPGSLTTDVISSSLGSAIPPAFLSQIDLPPLMVQPPPVPPPSFPTQPPFPCMDTSDLPPTDYDERTRLELGRNLKDDTSRDSLEEGETNDDSIEVIDLVRSPRDSDHRDRRYRGRSRSRDRYRRSRSHSRSRRRRSRSSDRDDRDDREYDRKQREVDREKERERKKKGLPLMRRNYLTVCSTTIWIGHLSKIIQEEQLSNIFGDYGDIVSINLIPPRGCAFVCMNRRQDAMKALHELKHFKIQGKSISVAWAPGKGMKDKEWKDYWEVDQGASFIPWNKIFPKTNFELLEEGGMLDQDTFPEWLKDTYSTIKKQQEERKAKEEEESKNKVEELPPLPSGPQPPPVLPSTAPKPDMSGPPPPQPQPPPPQPLPPPPMGMLPPPPFPIQPPGLLGPMGMPMPPGLVGPLGVPPPIMVPQQMLPRMPPPFNPPQSFGLMDGMPPPPLPNTGNPFAQAPPIIPANNNNNNKNNNNINIIKSNSTSNKDPTEMDVVDESEDEMAIKKEEVSIQSLPLPPSPFPGLPPLPNLGNNNREGVEISNIKRNEDTDMRMLDSDISRKRKWGGDDDGFRSRNNRWAERERERRGGGSPHERRNEDRLPHLPNPPPGMPPEFSPFPNRHGGRGPDEEDVYPPNMIDFPPRDFPLRDFPPRDFPPRAGPPNHFFNPRGPMFGPRGPAPGPHSPMNMRPPRHPGHPGVHGSGEVRGGWGPPPPQQGPPPPRGARFPLHHPPPPIPPGNRRMPGERKSRWGEPVEQQIDEMFSNQLEDVFPGPLRDVLAPPLGLPQSDTRPIILPDDMPPGLSELPGCPFIMQVDAPELQSGPTEIQADSLQNVCLGALKDSLSDTPKISENPMLLDSNIPKDSSLHSSKVLPDSTRESDPSQSVVPPSSEVKDIADGVSRDLTHIPTDISNPHEVSMSPKRISPLTFNDIPSSSPKHVPSNSCEDVSLRLSENLHLNISDSILPKEPENLPSVNSENLTSILSENIPSNNCESIPFNLSDNVPSQSLPTPCQNMAPPKLLEDMFANPLKDLKPVIPEDIFSEPIKENKLDPGDIFSCPPEVISSVSCSELDRLSCNKNADQEDPMSGVSLYSPEPGAYSENVIVNENSAVGNEVNTNKSSELSSVIPPLIPVTGVDLQTDNLVLMESLGGPSSQEEAVGLVQTSQESTMEPSSNSENLQIT